MDINQTNNISDFFSKVGNFDLFSFFGKLIKVPFDFFSSTGEYAHMWIIVKMTLAGVALFCIFVIAYCLVRLFEIRKKEHEYLHHEIEEYAHKHKEEENKKTIYANNKWQTVLDNVFSNNEGDWRLAIIEADAMLDDLMGQLGFNGDSLGEKLKMADQEKFKSLTLAWQVHNVRNKIAHEGASFELSHHEAKRLIAIYENIFSQYGFI